MLFARIAFGLVALFAGLRVLDPEQRWAALMMRGDRIEHAAVSYALTALALAAWPSLPVWAPGLGMIVLGVAVEGVQAAPGVVGAPQWGDVVANAVGALAATAPAVIQLARTQPRGRRRGRR